MDEESIWEYIHVKLVSKYEKRQAIKIGLRTIRLEIMDVSPSHR